MTKEEYTIKEYKEKPFDEIKHIDEFGNEYLEDRELMMTLNYYKWRNFKKVIDKVKIACNVSNNRVSDHFANIGKMVSIGSGVKRFQESYQLSKYTCYLIAQNVNPRKKQLP